MPVSDDLEQVRGQAPQEPQDVERDCEGDQRQENRSCKMDHAPKRSGETTAEQRL